MSIAVGQVVFAEDTSTGAVPALGTTVAATLTVSAGSALVVFVTHDTFNLPSGTTSIADNVNGSYPTHLQNVNDAVNAQRYILSAFLNSGAGSVTVTATFSGNTAFKAIQVVEVTGAKTTGSPDISAGQLQATPGTGTDAVTTGNGTSTAQPALIVGASGNFAGNAAPAVGTGFTNGGTGTLWGGSALVRVESKRVTATGAQAATFTTAIGGANGHISLMVVLDELSSAITGTGSAATSSFAATSSGNETFTGTGSAAESPFAASGSGTHTPPAITGTGSGAMASFAVSGTSSQTITGTGSAAEQPFAASASGNETFTGTGSAALASFAASGSGTHTPPAITGSGSAAFSRFAATAIGTPTFPFSNPGGDSKFLRNAQGTPIPIKGRTAFGLFLPTEADSTQFLDDCVSKGYNALEVGLIWHDPRSTRAPFANNSTLLPFTKQLNGSNWTGGLTYGTINNESPDFTQTNAAYWAFVVKICNNALQRGIFLHAVPLYMGATGASGTGEGWRDEAVANGNTKCGTYGTFIANTFKNLPNIIWMMAGDIGTAGNTFTSNELAAEQAFLAAHVAVSGQQSINWSGEPASGAISTDLDDNLGLNATTTVNGAYDFEGNIITQGLRAYARTTPEAVPSYLLEEPFDEEGSDGNSVNTNATQPTRRFQWWGWLTTIGGYMSGNGYVWPFNSSASLPLRDDWKNHVNTQCAQDMGRLNGFIDSIAWYNLVPSGQDGMRTLVTSGAGTGGGKNTTTTVTAACDPAGALMVAYVPPAHTGSMTFDLGTMSGLSRARWFDPTAGTYTAASGGAFNLSASTHAFTVPGTNTAGDADWVMVFDVQPTTPTGDVAAAMSPFAASASGAETFTSTASVATRSFASTASGTETFTSTAAGTVSSFAASGSGTNTPPAITGTGSGAMSPFGAVASNTGLYSVPSFLYMR